MCTAFVDSVMEIGAYALSEHDKRHLLYSAATTQSTMDYLCKAVEDDAVDSPPSHGIIPLPISSPSPLRGRGAGQTSRSRHRDTNGAQHSLNLELSQSPNNVLVKVGLLYLLFCTALSTTSLYSVFLNHIARPDVSSPCSSLCCEHYRQYRRLVVLFFLVFSKFLLDISSSRVKRWQTRFILS